LDTLQAAGVEAYLWKPSQFDEIVKILRSKPFDSAARKA